MPTRTRAHIIADLSVNHFERFVLRCGFTIERVTHDYGYDLIINTFDARGEPESGTIHVQLKATDHLHLLSEGTTFRQRVTRAHLLMRLDNVFPVFLVVYDGQQDCAYWVNVREYARRLAPAILAAGSKTLSIEMDTRAVIDEPMVRQIVRQKNELVARLRSLNDETS